MAPLPPEIAARLERQLALFERVRALPAEGGFASYAGHMRLRAADGRESDVLLGTARRLGGGVSIIDWRTAPLAEVFFAFEEGDDYEVEVEGRLLEGVVLEKNLLAFGGDGPRRVDMAGGILSRTEAGAWTWEPGRPFPRVLPRPPGSRGPFRSPLEVQLDPRQRSAVDLPKRRHLLLLGEAGFGKTTVALHRLLALRERAGEHFRGLVLVPTPGLRRLTELMLEHRGVRNVEVWTYDAWAARVARHAFPDLPRRESGLPPGAVVRLKRHRALAGELSRFVEEFPDPAVDPERRRPPRALATRLDLELLFGDRARMDRVVDEGKGEIRRTAVEDAAEHTRIQFSDPSEHGYAHVSAERLVTVDGRRIDEGTPMENADSIDVEDYAVLFEIDRLRARARDAKPASLPLYDCVVVDEAQEFAPLELSIMGRAVRRGGCLVVAGDAAQQVDPTSDFPGWEGVMASLRAEDHARVVLEVNYRCPAEVTELARGVVGAAAPPPRLAPSIARARHRDPLHLAIWLTGELRALRADDPSASIAVICRTHALARAFAQTLRRALEVQLGIFGDFDFQPGLVVTSVPEVKGLEFDYVFVPDADAGVYPDTADSRRSLYVALTRATHRLVLGCAAPRASAVPEPPGPWSPLLPPAEA